MPKKSPPKVEKLAVPALRATELLRATGVTYGPYLGVRDNGALVVWAGLAGEERRFMAQPLSAEGRPSGALTSLGASPDAPGLVALRPHGEGYVLLYTRTTPTGDLLEGMCLNARGAATSSPVLLSQRGGAGLWVESVPASAGSLVFFAARAKQQRADVFVTPLDAHCKPQPPVAVARAAQAWQAVRTASGALLATVQEAEHGGAVRAVAVDPAGKLGAPVQVQSEGADIDLDAIAVQGKVVLGFTDQRAFEPRVVTALLDASGRVLATPTALTLPEGEQTLVRLVPALNANGPSYAAWERLDAASDKTRHFALSALSPEGRQQGPISELDYQGEAGGVPELSANARGLSALTLATACPARASCESAPLTPFYVELNRELAPVAAEPLRLEPLAGKPAELGFGLGCTASGCFSIAALSHLPAPVFATELAARSRHWRAPVRVDRPATHPFVREHEVVSAMPSMAAFALAHSGPRDYLASISEFDSSTPWKKLDKPASDGRLEPLRAEIRLEMLDPTALRASRPLAVSPISIRADSRGGVALAPGAPDKGDLLAAWAGLDAGVPQVFLTLVTKQGTQREQRMLTRKPGDVGSIAAAWVGDGWVIAWVDARAGDYEVFSAKVDPKLTRVGAEQRITHAVGGATDLSIAFDGTNLRLAWAEARDSELPGRADIFSIALRPKDASALGSETRVTTTRSHTFSPTLQPFRKGFALSFLERGEEGENGQIRVLKVNPDGGVGETITVETDGDPRALGLGCEAERCTLAAIVERDNDAALSVASWDGAAASSATPVLTLAPGSPSVTPLVRGNEVFWLVREMDETRIVRARLEP